MIYPVDRAIQLLNNWGLFNSLKFKDSLATQFLSHFLFFILKSTVYPHGNDNNNNNNNNNDNDNDNDNNTNNNNNNNNNRG